MKNKEYLKLGDLDIYKLMIEVSQEVWQIYERLNWEDKKIMGYQFITATDSVGANFAEGYGRWHYKDRIKFYYNSRGSLIEAKHWTLTLSLRKKINKEETSSLLGKFERIHSMLNKYISSCYKNI